MSSFQLFVLSAGAYAISMYVYLNALDYWYKRRLRLDEYADKPKDDDVILFAIFWPIHIVVSAFQKVLDLVSRIKVPRPFK